MELGPLLQSLLQHALPGQPGSTVPKPPAGASDDSALVEFSQAYHQLGKQDGKEQNDAKLLQWWIVFDAISAVICRQAQQAGLTKMEGQTITRYVLIAAAGQLMKAEDGLAIEEFSARLWGGARWRITAALEEKQHPLPPHTHPYYASVAWRKKHRPQGPGPD